MKRVYLIALSLLFTAYLIGIQFQIAGAARAPMAAMFALPTYLWPLAMPLFGLAVLVLITAFRFNRIYPHMNATELTKENRLLIAGVLFGPALAVMMQTYLGLEFFSLIDKHGMMRGLAIFQSLTFLVIGNYVAIQDPENGAVFKTPWTVKSIPVCTVIHRYLGNGIAAISIMTLIALIFVPGKLVIFTHVATLVMLKVTAFIYSMMLWRRLEAQQSAMRENLTDLQ